MQYHILVQPYLYNPTPVIAITAISLRTPFCAKVSPERLMNLAEPPLSNAENVEVAVTGPSAAVADVNVNVVVEGTVSIVITTPVSARPAATIVTLSPTLYSPFSRWAL